MIFKNFEYRQLYKYLAETPYYLKNDIQKLNFINSIKQYKADHKYDPNLIETKGEKTLNIYLFKNNNNIINKIEKMSVSIEEILYDRLIIKVDTSYISQIAEIPDVKSISLGGGDHFLYNEDDFTNW